MDYFILMDDNDPVDHFQWKRIISREITSRNDIKNSSFLPKIVLVREIRVGLTDNSQLYQILSLGSLNCLLISETSTHINDIDDSLLLPFVFEMCVYEPSWRQQNG